MCWFDQVKSIQVLNIFFLVFFLKSHAAVCTSQWNIILFYFIFFYDKFGRKLPYRLKFSKIFTQMLCKKDITFVICSQDKLIENSITCFSKSNASLDFVLLSGLLLCILETFSKFSAHAIPAFFKSFLGFIVGFRTRTRTTLSTMSFRNLGLSSNFLMGSTIIFVCCVW